MDKDEILEKSRKENQRSDERDKFIENRAYINAHTAILWANFVLFTTAAIQDMRTGQPFAEPMLFLLTSVVSTAAKDFTFYHHYRLRKHLIQSILDGAILLVFLIWFLRFGLHLF